MIVFKDPRGGTSDIKGLEPWTDYICRVQPKYNNSLEGTSAVVKPKTGPGSKCENILEEITTHVSYKQTILIVNSFIHCASHSVEVFTFVTVCLSNVLQYRKSFRVIQFFSGFNCNQLQWALWQIMALSFRNPFQSINFKRKWKNILSVNLIIMILNSWLYSLIM